MIKLIAVTLGIATLATMAGYASGKALSVPVQPVSIAAQAVPVWLLKTLKLTDKYPVIKYSSTAEITPLFFIP